MRRQAMPSARRLRSADLPGHSAVAARLAVGNGTDRAPYLHQESRAFRGQRQAEGSAPARDIFLELCFRSHQKRVRTCHGIDNSGRVRKHRPSSEFSVHDYTEPSDFGRNMIQGIYSSSSLDCERHHTRSAALKMIFHDLPRPTWMAKTISHCEPIYRPPLYFEP